MQHSITAVVLTKNEEAMLPACLSTLQWCKNLLVVDGGSSDKTVAIAESVGAKVLQLSHSSFARRRTEALKQVTTDWVFYVDADERVSPTLAKEIAVSIETQKAAVFSLYRKNICYGKEFQYGGWSGEKVTRVFKTSAISGWEGDIHESPVFEGETSTLKTPLIHHTHRSTADGLRKSSDWTLREAKLLAKSGIPTVTFMTLIRKGFLEFFRRAVLRQGYRDGMPGLIEAIVQGINRIFVYIQVWELQQRPELQEQYTKRDADILTSWKAEQRSIEEAVSESEPESEGTKNS